LAAVVGQDVGASAHAWAAWSKWFLGYPDQAISLSQRALALAKASEHPFSLCFTHYIAGATLHLMRREYAQAAAHLVLVESLAVAEHFPVYQAGAALLGGWLLAEQGQVAAGIAQMRQGLASWRATGAEAAATLYTGLLAQAYGRAGQVAEGLRHVDGALNLVVRSGQRFWEAELHHLRGQLLAQAGSAQEAEAATCYQRAVEIARSQDNRAVELRAATSLACLWQQQGRHAEAYGLLSPICQWFHEGFDTPDLQEARSVLEQLT
jgi:predicted ATPase